MYMSMIKLHRFYCYFSETYWIDKLAEDGDYLDQEFDYTGRMETTWTRSLTTHVGW